MECAVLRQMYLIKQQSPLQSPLWRTCLWPSLSKPPGGFIIIYGVGVFHLILKLALLFFHAVFKGFFFFFGTFTIRHGLQ